MLKILSGKQIRELDTFTIQHDPIASIDLMEKACRAFVSWFKDRFDSHKSIYVFCGTGNNGGDGLGIARLLHSWNYDIRVFVIKASGSESSDFRINLDRLSKLILVNTINDEGEIPDCSNADVIIDGIFGSGLTRPVEGLFAKVLEMLNGTEAIRVAIDIPSGLLADQPSTGTIFKAHHTVTFQIPKLAFFLPDYGLYTGELHIVKIGLSKKYLAGVETKNLLIQRIDVAKMLKPSGKFDHKGTYGKALLVAGSEGKMGAAILAATAALRAGVGLMTVHVPKSGVSIVQTGIPEAMAQVDSHEKWLSDSFELEEYSSVGIGPGLGTSKETVKAFGQILQSGRKPMVIDADGLNILAAHPELLHVIPKHSILTPHIKEFERLVGSWSSDFDRLEKQRQFAKMTDSFLVVKGAHTSITAPEGQMYFNSTGNPGMATGGSGDVLTGIVTGLLAQNYEPLDAAILGVYLHGLAGDIAAAKIGMQAMIASDITASLGKAFRKISK